MDKKNGLYEELKQKNKEYPENHKIYPIPPSNYANALTQQIARKIGETLDSLAEKEQYEEMIQLTVEIENKLNNQTTSELHKPLSSIQYRYDQYLVPIMLVLNNDPGFNSGTKFYLSSLSVFYEDVYGRHYQSRILYKRYVQNDCLYFEAIGNESFRIEKLPLEPAINYDIQRIRDIEGDIPVIYRPNYRAFHLFSVTKLLEGTKIAGTTFTKNKDMILHRVVFHSSGYPVFEVKIGDKESFRIRPKSSEDGTILGYIITDVTVPLGAENNTRSYSEYGLFADGANDDQYRRSLYENIYTTLINRLGRE